VHTHNSSNIKRKYPGHTHISFSWERLTSIWNFHQHNNTFISFVDKAIAWLPYWTYAIVTCKTNCAWHYKVIYYLRTQIFSLVNKQFNLLPTVQNLNIKIAIRNQEEYLSTSFFQYNTDMCIFLGELIPYLLDILHHNSFNFWDLGFHLGKLADLLRVVHTVLHVLFKFWSLIDTEEK